MDYGGEIFKIVPAAGMIDCNANGRADACDIAAGSSFDVNGDGVPDECRCPGDWDGSGTTEPADIAQFVQAWLSSLQGGTIGADYDHNGVIEPTDLAAFINSWLAALSGGC